MIVGNPNKFAIESEITTIDIRPSLLGVGFFVIHIHGSCFGVRESDATTLACSFDAVQERANAKGMHRATFAKSETAGDIADAFRYAIYQEAPPPDKLWNLAQAFSESPVRWEWAPDGGAAFDDGSYVLQFDVEDRVRLIAFRCDQEGLHDPNALKELWLPSDEFYQILETWHRQFLNERERMLIIGA